MLPKINWLITPQTFKNMLTVHLKLAISFLQKFVTFQWKNPLPNTIAVASSLHVKISLKTKLIIWFIFLQFFAKARYILF